MESNKARPAPRHPRISGTSYSPSSTTSNLRTSPTRSTSPRNGGTRNQDVIGDHLAFPCALLTSTDTMAHVRRMRPVYPSPNFRRTIHGI